MGGVEGKEMRKSARDKEGEEEEEGFIGGEIRIGMEGRGNGMDKGTDM